MVSPAFPLNAARPPPPPNPQDLDNDWKQSHLDIMPNLRTAIRDKGAHFLNHVAAQPVCGPSRSSLLQGRFPHNVGYYANDDPPSIANYLAVANNSVGTWLTAAGFHTAFIGKYVNGCEKQVPEGWNVRWARGPAFARPRPFPLSRSPRAAHLPSPRAVLGRIFNKQGDVQCA